MELAQIFHANITNFVNEFLDVFPSNFDLMTYKIILKNAPPTIVIESFIKEVIPKKQLIKDRDPTFFSQRLFHGLFDKIHTLWESLDDEDRQIVWDWFDTFVILAEKYSIKK